MSGINGDKARFNRERKKKIARRLRNEKRFHGGRTLRSNRLPLRLQRASRCRRKQHLFSTPEVVQAQPSRDQKTLQGARTCHEGDLRSENV